MNPFNNTEVQCVAYGHGIGAFSPASVLLTVGVPAPVNNLTLSNDSCCYKFSWTSPFTLPLSGYPLLKYNINVTNNGVMIYQTNVSVTHWTYCPQELANPTVSIAAANDVGQGKISNYHLPVDKSILF